MALPLANRKSEGVALVITLILLAVTLVMAIAFLAISRRERGSVTTTEDAAAAKYAMEASLYKAEARIVTQMLATTNPYIFSLVVSTNYVNQAGFTNTSLPAEANLANVNYDHLVNSSAPLTADELAQNIANLYYDPRPPVYYSNDFRFYLDLNQNGRYDTNGVVTNFDNESPPQGLGTTSLQVGDPEWIGVLAHPDQPHGPNNPFIARYCFIAVPANSLDLNSIHNQALDETRAFGSGNTPVNPNTRREDAYWRDQGVGTWELNLAAFLTDLDTNRWDPANEPYLFPEGAIGGSVAFDDARALVAWRYSYSYPLLDSADALFRSSPGWVGLPQNLPLNNGADYYTVGQQSTFDANFANLASLTLPWVGAPQTNVFFSSPSELFNVNQSDLDFVTNLYSAGTNNSTYDRYAFYRMLAQMGTDTRPARDKINLNYQNAFVTYPPATRGSGVNGPAYTNVAQAISMAPNYETNFISWQPEDFFTVAANQMLKAYSAEWFEASPSNYMQTYYGIYGTNYNYPDGQNVTNIQYQGQANQIPSFGVTNIPVYINNSFVYSPAINRILQLAANIYDATTNNSSITLGDSNYPSVFRPVFYKATEYNYFLRQYFTNVYIKGFEYVKEPLNNAGVGAVLSPPMELTDLPFGYSVSNVWGVPMIIGAKKGLPNFNGFEVVNTFFIERELQFNRNSVAPNPGGIFPYGRTYTTNQQYVMGISNAFAMSDWNSYANPYNNLVTIYAQDQLSVALTNSDNYAKNNFFVTNTTPPPTYTPLTIQPWTSQILVMPFGTNVSVMQNLSYYPSPRSTNNLYTYFKTPGKTVTLQDQNGNNFSYTGPCFIPNSMDPQNYLDSGTPPMPQFGLLETNHLQAYMLDTDKQGNLHILDSVQLGSMNYGFNVNAVIQDPPDGTGLWSTNSYSVSSTPWGVVNQINVSTENNFPFPGEDQDGGGPGGQWSTTPVPGLGTDSSPAAQQAFCAAFFSAVDQANYPPGTQGTVTNILYSMQAPFTPMRQIVQRYVLQANDPLVHYLSSDLTDLHDSSTNRMPMASTNVTSIVYANQLSDRYLPWSGQSPGPYPVQTRQLLPTSLYLGNPPQPANVDANEYNFAYKDPLVWSADNWDFPGGKYPTVGWLGRVHRGTPWQSVFLKSTNIMEMGGSGYATWQAWTGDMNSDDANNESPVQDRLLFDIFTATPDDDATRGQVSVNIGADDPTNELAGLASWSALLSGMVVFAANSNQPDQTIGPVPGYQSPVSGAPWYQSSPYFNIITNQPLGALAYPPPNSSGVVSITNAAMWQIVHGINSTRTNLPTIDGLHVFEHVGDILATPQLSDGSPFLETIDPAQVDGAVSDEMYEWLPQQMLGLMTVSGTQQSPPRYVVYCYGQALKPAVNGIVTSGQFSGMCTNYQVVAESASRVVIEVQNTPTPVNSTATPRVIVEQYNTLPPN